MQDRPSQVTERERSARVFAQILIEGVGLFEDRYRPLLVLLKEEDEAERSERLGPYGGFLAGVPLQRRPEPSLAFLETLRFGPLGKGQEVLGVPAANHRFVLAFLQLLASELPDGL